MMMDLSSLYEVRTTDCNDTRLTYYSDATMKGRSIGYIQFCRRSGQIGLFAMNHSRYMYKGLGKQMLTKAIGEMREIGTPEVWAVSTDNHEFWSNVWGKAFQPRNPAHRSVTGPGYFMPL